MLRNWFFYFFGLAILLANKARYAVTGYHRPRDFSVEDTGRAAKYDHEFVAGWEQVLIDKGYGGEPFAGKRLLELGPGADLGVGLILVAKGVESYVAFDKNPLVDWAPKKLHKAVLKSINDAGSRARAAEALSAYEQGQPTSLRFKQDSSFSFSWLPNQSLDLVVSNAAFEHFDDVRGVLEQVSRVLASGGVLCAHVDLQTHTRVLRDRDPLNIYRYSPLLWRLAKFSGIPNRVRPAVYEKTLRDLGFAKVEVVPVSVMDKRQVERVRRSLQRKYRKDPLLGVLSFTIIARKA